MKRSPDQATLHPLATLRAGGRLWRAADLAAPPQAGGPDAGLADATVADALDFCRRWALGDESFALTTSGTTGAPKAIRLTRGQMAASAHATAAALGLRAGHSCLVCLPTRFVAGRMMLVRALVLGLEATLVEPSSDPFAGLPDDAAFDFAAFVPLQMQAMLEAERNRSSRLDSMVAILVGGGPISPALAARIAPLRAPVFHTFAMTETATHVALARLNGQQARDLFVPLPDVLTRIDARGCLAVSGPMTAGAWIQTNDLVERREDGAFRWVGRVDLVVNTGGVKVAVEPLEAEIAALLSGQQGDAARRRLIVAGLPDQRLGQRLTLVLEGAPLDDATSAALLGELHAQLGPWRTPRTLHTLARFAETTTGKIDRAATLALLS